MTQHISENANKNKKTKLTIIIAGIVAIALVLTAVGAFWFIKQNSRVVAARKQCEIKVAQLTKASNTWKSLATNSLLVKLAKTDSKQGRELKKTLKEKVPDAVYCTSNSPEELGSKSAEALASSAWYTTEAQKVRKLALALLKATGEYKEDDSTTKDKGKAKDKDKAKDKKEAEKKKEDLAKKEKEIQQATNNVIRDANTTPRRQQTPVTPQPQPQPQPQPKQQPKQQTPQKETPQHKTPQNTKPAENKENKDKNGGKDKNTPEKKKAKTGGETITEGDNKNKQDEKDKNGGNNNENKDPQKDQQHEQQQDQQHEQDKQHEQDQPDQTDNKQH